MDSLYQRYFSKYDCKSNKFEPYRSNFTDVISFAIAVLKVKKNLNLS